MAEEFQTGFCGGSWRNSSRSMFGSSPCSSVINDLESFGWPGEFVNMKGRSSDESGSVSDGPMVFQDIQKPLQPATDWDQALFRGSGRGESNYPPMLQEDLNSSLNYRHRQQTGVADCPQIQNGDSPLLFSSKDSSVNAFKQANQGFSLEQEPLNSVMSSASYGYPSTLLQTLFDMDSQPQHSPFDDRPINVYPSTTTDHRTKLNESLIPLPKFSSFLKPSLRKQEAVGHLQLSDDTPFWNASAAAQNDTRDSFFSSTQSQFLSSTFEEKPSCPNLTAKSNNEEVRDSCSVVKKINSEPAFKRPRIETPSPLPTFKVRKEKLGDRVTALQQLVSPFGKTDTASVLHEAIDYIKHLHDQLIALSTPYMKNGAATQPRQVTNKLKDTEGPNQDLRSRGLCLVPISSTFPVASQITTDFWTPPFGGAFR